MEASGRYVATVEKHGSVSVYGYGGNDVIDLSRLSSMSPWVYVNGGDGSDTIYGSNGDDTLEGAGSDDTLYGLGGND